MKIKIDRELLLNKLNKVYKFVPTKSIIPALDNIKFEVKGNTMSITAFNGEIQCKLSCSVECKESGFFCLPAKLFVSTVRLLRENELVLNITEKKATIKCGKSTYNMTVNVNPDEFPFAIFKDHKNEMVMLQSAFSDFASKTSSFAGDDGLRPWMLGMNMAFNEKKEMIFISATRFVMCKAIVPVISVNKWANVTIPVTSVKKVCELCNKGEMNVLSNENAVLFSSAANSDEEFEIIATCINENYPKTDGLFNAERKSSFLLNVSEVIDCVNRVELYANPLVGALNFKLVGGELTVSGNDEDFGNDGTEVISVTNEGNFMMDKDFSAAQINKILGCVDEVECFVKWSEENNVPIMFQGKNEFVSFQFLVTQLKGK